jgi:hypothetical protein
MSLWSTCIHEAAHAVIALPLGKLTENSWGAAVSCEPWRTDGEWSAGRMFIDSTKAEGDPGFRAFGYLVQAYVGALAEYRICNITPAQAKDFGRGDVRAIADVCKDLNPDDRRWFGSVTQRTARRAVERYRVDIELVAEALFNSRTKELTKAQIERILHPHFATDARRWLEREFHAAFDAPTPTKQETPIEAYSPPVVPTVYRYVAPTRISLANLCARHWARTRSPNPKGKVRK